VTFFSQSEFGDLRQYSQLMMSYIAQTITYPLSVTSTVMAVNGARIKGGRPPFMIVYGGWVACLKDLHQKVRRRCRFRTALKLRTAHRLIATNDSEFSDQNKKIPTWPLTKPLIFVFRLPSCRLIERVSLNQFFFRWDISVICPIIVLKPAITIPTNLRFRTSRPN